jgi:uncharacterized membrane protein YccC
MSETERRIHNKRRWLMVGIGVALAIIISEPTFIIQAKVMALVCIALGAVIGFAWNDDPEGDV